MFTPLRQTRTPCSALASLSFAFLLCMAALQVHELKADELKKSKEDASKAAPEVKGAETPHKGQQRKIDRAVRPRVPKAI